MRWSIVATNADGSVNGKQFIVTGILESATGPGGRDGYVHIDDAAEVLRMEEPAGQRRSPSGSRTSGISAAVRPKLDGLLAKEVNKEGKPIFEVHTWEKLSPFFNIARMIDVMTFFIKTHAHRHRPDQHHERDDHGRL